MAGLDLAVARQHIYNHLTAATALTGLSIVEGLADSETTYPFVQFELLSGVGQLVNGVGATYILGRPRYTVKVVAQDTPFSALDGYVAAIYMALHNTSGTVSSGQALGSLCWTPISYSEAGDGGVMYRHYGYEVEVYTRS